MCGITGYYSPNKEINASKFYQAHLLIKHRGPDDEGFFCSENESIISCKGDDTISYFNDLPHITSYDKHNLIFGYRRLSIIDLSNKGHQPYHFKNLHMVYNGEIYNYIEIRDELKEKGYQFDSDTDTEVVIKAISEWGVKAFNKFNGMWAISIYNSENKSILLCRDRFGIKPLFYSYKNNDLIFGSEIKFITSLLDNVTSNSRMVKDYIENNFLYHTDETFFNGINQLEPGTYAEIGDNKIKIKKYYEINHCASTNKEELEELLIDSIKLRLRSDVKVGSLLSGGVDSSTIVGFLKHYNLVSELDTFSITFNEKEFDFEKSYINETIKQTQFNNFQVTLTPNNQDIETLIYTLEQPFRTLSQMAMFLIYKYIKSETDVVVLLNGEGADEIFSGYTKHYYYNLSSSLQNFKLKRFFNEKKYFKDNLGVGNVEIYKQILKIFYRHYINKKPINRKIDFFNFNYSPTNPSEYNDIFKNQLWTNLSYSALREYLMYADKTSMQFSLESRVPFLDFRLVEKAFSLKNNQKIKDGVSKYMLREIAKGKIPSSIYNRKDKKGFFVPQSYWLKNSLSDEIQKAFDDINNNGFFDYMKTENIMKYYNAAKDKNDGIIWRTYCLYKWAKIYNVKG